MSLHLEEISSQVTQGSHAVLLLDGAGWHQTGGKLRVPANISLLHLPAYSPELNPVENIWQFLRQNHLSNRVFENYDEILDACCAAWNALTAEVKAHRLNRHTSLGVGCCLMPLVLDERIRSMCKELGQREAARKLGVSRMTLAKALSDGHGSLTRSIQRRLAQNGNS